MRLKLLKKVRSMILAKPEHFNMDHWYHDPSRPPVLDLHDNGYTPRLEEIDPADADIDKCGTTACLAGWMVLLDPKLKGKNYHAIAEAVGVPSDLFHVDDWPSSYLERLENGESEAKVAADLLGRVMLADNPYLIWVEDEDDNEEDVVWR